MSTNRKTNEKTALLSESNNTDTIISIGPSIEDLPQDVMNIIAAQLRYKKDLANLRKTSVKMNQSVEQTTAGQLARDAIDLQPSNFRIWVAKKQSTVHDLLVIFFAATGLISGGYGGMALGDFVNIHYNSTTPNRTFPHTPPPDNDLPSPHTIPVSTGSVSSSVTFGTLGNMFGLATGIIIGTGVNRALTYFGFFSTEQAERSINTIHTILAQPIKETSREEFYAARFDILKK